MELDLHTKECVVAHYSILGITSMYGTSAYIQYTGKPPYIQYTGKPPYIQYTGKPQCEAHPWNDYTMKGNCSLDWKYD